MSPLRPAVRDAFVRWTERFEGRISWLYLDVKALPTIGSGLLVRTIDEALTLPFVDENGMPASASAIRNEFLRIKSTPTLARLGAGAAKKIARLRLTEASLDRLALDRLDVMARALVQRFPALPSWPAPAQLAACSLAWAVGAGWPSKFPLCSAHLDRQDFAAASEESDIDATGNPGVVPRSAAQRQLLLAAARVVATGASPAVLYERPEQVPAGVLVREDAPVPGAREAAASAALLARERMAEDVTAGWRRGRD